MTIWSAQSGGCGKLKGGVTVAEFAAIPLFTDAWIADTSHLSRVERGLYMDLLILIWRSPECRVPNDIAWLARRLRADASEAEILQSILSEFCIIDVENDVAWISQKRLMREWQYTSKKRQKNIDAAKYRWKKEKDPCERIADALPAQQCERNAPSPSPSPSPSVKKERDKSLSCANDGFEEFWAVVPRKVAKAAAAKAYRAAIKQTDAKTLLDGMARYAASRKGEDPQYTSHPATWLNAGRWSDHAAHQPKADDGEMFGAFGRIRQVG
jgi:uncharacterized protein YdaU (DUF1376 family)